jgi:hypothetical protein
LLLAVGGLISAWLLRSAEWPRTDRTRQGAAALLAWGLIDNSPAKVTVADGNALTLSWNSNGIWKLD